ALPAGRLLRPFRPHRPGAALGADAAGGGAEGRGGGLSTASLRAVIPAGGAGSRLWPRSRRSTPKHVLPLSGSGRPLLRETYERIRPLAAEIYVLTEELQVSLIREILPELKADHLIVEPAARGTTNALGLAAMTLAQEDPEAVMISIPADHVVHGREAFGAAVRRAAALAEASGELVT